MQVEQELVVQVEVVRVFTITVRIIADGAMEEKVERVDLEDLEETEEQEAQVLPDIVLLFRPSMELL